MEVVTTINQRILQIQVQLASAPHASAPAPVASPGASSSSAFAAALAQAVATQQTSSATSVATVGSGADQVNDDGVPLELLGYGNGTVPTSALSSVGNTDHQLWAPAARSYEALQTAAAHDGVTIGITDSYRSYAQQVELADAKGLYSQGGLAAVPKTSDHGWGIALDLRLDASAQAWMREHAGEYGFVEDVPREPWHWTYRPTH